MVAKVEGKRRFERRPHSTTVQAVGAEPRSPVAGERGSGGGFLTALLTILCLVLAAALGYGYVLHQEREARLAALEAQPPAVAPESPGDEKALAQAEAEIERLEAALASELEAEPAGTATSAPTESELATAAAEIERTRAARIEAEAALRAAEARIAALESEMAAGMPLASNSAITTDGATSDGSGVAEMQIELRLLAGERDASRRQVDALLVKNAELEAALGERVQEPQPSFRRTMRPIYTLGSRRRRSRSHACGNWSKSSRWPLPISMPYRKVMSGRMARAGQAPASRAISDMTTTSRWTRHAVASRPPRFN